MNEEILKQPQFNQILKDATKECDDYYQMLNRIDTWCQFNFCLFSPTNRLAMKIRDQIGNLQLRHGRAQVLPIPPKGILPE